MSDCRFGVSPVNYPAPDPGLVLVAKIVEEALRALWNFSDN